MKRGRKRYCVVCGDLMTIQGGRKTCCASCSDIRKRISKLTVLRKHESIAREKELARRTREKRYEEGWKRPQGKNGYIALHGKEAAAHPMAKHGWVNEHVYICYNTYPTDPKCHYCGKQLRWSCNEASDAPLVNVDHKDEDVTNNDPSNLVPSCVTCNTRRSGRLVKSNLEALKRRQTSGEGICSSCGKILKSNIAFAGHCRWGCQESTFIPLKIEKSLH